MGNIHTGIDAQNDLTELQKDVLQGLSTTSSALSVIGSMVVIFWYWKNKDECDFNKEIIVWLSVFDLHASIWFLMGPIPQDHGETFCAIQGSFIQFASLGAVIFNACVGFNIYSWVCEKKSIEKLRKRLPKYLCVSTLLPLLTMVLIFSFESRSVDEPVFGPTLLWCWIGDLPNGGENRTVLWQMLIFYLFVVLAVMSNAFFFLKVQAELLGKHHDDAVRPIIEKLNAFLFVFVFLWFWGLLNRLSSGLGYKPFWTVMMHAIFVPLQGFFNMILFVTGGYAVKFMKEKLQRFMSRELGMRVTYDGSNPSFRDNEFVLETPIVPEYIDLKIFACTFNMGEGEVPKDMSKLLPPDQDLYIIGLQECLPLDAMRESMQAYCSKSEPFKRFETEIGSTNTRLGFHGYIALTILVKEKYVEDGSFVVDERAISQVKRGANLGVTRAANKGGVGLPCRFFDQRLAFVTAHLASDSHGKTKLQKRIKDASNMISGETGLCLAPDDLGFDFPSVNHHTFVLGDFNYRMSHLQAAPDEILGLVASCSKAGSEVAARGEDGNLGGNGKMTDDASATYVERDAAVQLAWKPILEHDELHNSILAGTSFSQFEEAPITFAPSYQRYDGEQGVLTDDSDIESLRRAFALKNKKDGKDRVPSYTDRILFSSFAGVKDRLSCEEYYINEDVVVSDHRPVCGKFNLQVNIRSPDVLYYEGQHRALLRSFVPKEDGGNDYLSMISPTSPTEGSFDPSSEVAKNSTLSLREKLPMQEFPKYKVQIFDLDVQWDEQAVTSLEKRASLTQSMPPSDLMASTMSCPVPRSSDEVSLQKSSLPARQSTDPQRIRESAPKKNMIRINASFPVPSEDVFSSERKVYEISSGIEAGPTWDKAKSKFSKRKETKIVKRTLSGEMLTLKAFAPAISHLHVLLKIETSTHSGQAVVDLKNAALVCSDPNLPQYADFEKVMTNRGVRTGVLSGKIQVSLSKESRRRFRARASGKNQSFNQSFTRSNRNFFSSNRNFFSSNRNFRGSKERVTETSEVELRTSNISQTLNASPCTTQKGFQKSLSSPPSPSSNDVIEI